jgi:hypothetical protein
MAWKLDSSLITLTYGKFLSKTNDADIFQTEVGSIDCFYDLSVLVTSHFTVFGFDVTASEQTMTLVAKFVIRMKG